MAAEPPILVGIVKGRIDYIGSSGPPTGRHVEIPFYDLRFDENKDMYEKIVWTQHNGEISAHTPSVIYPLNDAYRKDIEALATAKREFEQAKQKYTEMKDQFYETPGGKWIRELVSPTQPLTLKEAETISTLIFKRPNKLNTVSDDMKYACRIELLEKEKTFLVHITAPTSQFLNRLADTQHFTIIKSDRSCCTTQEVVYKFEGEYPAYRYIDYIDDHRKKEKFVSREKDGTKFLFIDSPIPEIPYRDAYYEQIMAKYAPTKPAPISEPVSTEKDKIELPRPVEAVTTAGQ